MKKFNIMHIFDETDKLQYFIKSKYNPVEIRQMYRETNQLEPLQFFSNRDSDLIQIVYPTKIGYYLLSNNGVYTNDKSLEGIKILRKMKINKLKK